MPQLRREWIALALVLAGLLRAALLVSHDPLIGYANQQDMHRTSACLGLFPAVETPRAATPDAPIALYRPASSPQGCYQSSEVVIAGAVMAAARALEIDGGGIRLQWIGWAKLGLLVAAVLLIAYALHRHPNAALIHGLVVLLLMSDPVVTLWFNTLYTEFGVIWGLYAAIGAICALAVSERASFLLAGLLAAGLLALAFSREQYALLAVALATVSWPWLWSRSPHLAVSAFGVALVAGVISFALVPRERVVHEAYRADAYLGVVLPAASKPQHALNVLQLPERCAPLVGATWALQRGENVREACPEALALSSVAFLRFVGEDSMVLARALARVLPAAQSMAPPYLGTLEGAQRVSLRSLPWWAFSPLDAIASRLPGKIFAAFAIAAFLAAPLAFLAAIAWARPGYGRRRTGLLFAMLAGGTALYAALTTAFGDGLSEAARHFLPGSLAIYALLIAALASAAALFGRWFLAPKEHALEIGVGLAAVAIIALALPTVFAWAQLQPLAIGVLDQPAGRKATFAGLQLRGWALDPQGVESVEVELGRLRKAARHGEPSADLKGIYPGYPEGAHARFALDLTAEDLAQAGAPAENTLRVLARNRAGVVTEIDRRRLDFSP